MLAAASARRLALAPRARGLAHHAPQGTSFEPAVIGARLALNPIADKQVRPRRAGRFRAVC